MNSMKGLSLVEVLIAMVILLFVSMALMQTALVSIESNMKNVLRDEAVAVADTRITEARNLGFGALAPDGASLAGQGCPADFIGAPGNFANGIPYQRSLKGISTFSFCTNRNVRPLGANDTQVDVTVGWSWKGQTYTHSSSAVIAR